LNPSYEANPYICPNNPSQLWRLFSPVYHVIDDPNTIPLDLATRLIQVITTKCGSDSIYRAWALPHLEHELQKPMDQTEHNHSSFFWQQHNHPEYPYKIKTPDTLLDINPVESSNECSSNEMTTKSITCKPLTPPCQRHNDVDAAKVNNCNAIRYAWESNLQLPILETLILLLTATQHNIKLQKQPKTHQFLLLPLYLLTPSNKFQHKHRQIPCNNFHKQLDKF
jgi:hypothetical protein